MKTSIYKGNSFGLKSIRFLYFNELISNDFEFETGEFPDNKIEYVLKNINDITLHLINILKQPIHPGDKEKCSDAYTQFTRLNNILNQNIKHSNEIFHVINEAMLTCRSKKFAFLINEFFFSPIVPELLVSILSLISSIMICENSSIVKELFMCENFISTLAKIIEEPKNGINEFLETDLSLNIPDFCNGDEPKNDFSINDYRNEDYCFTDDVIFEKKDEFNARKYACYILIDFFNIFMKMNEAEKAQIKLPDFEPFFILIYGGVCATCITSKSNASEYTLKLLLVVITDFISDVRNLKIEILKEVFFNLIQITKDPQIQGSEYALRSLYKLNFDGLLLKTENVYDTQDFIEILNLISYQDHDYSYELMAFVHSIFFSYNQMAIKAFMMTFKSGIINNLIQHLAYNKDEKVQFGFCYFCQDLLQLRFVDPKFDFFTSNSDMINFFDSIGIINFLVYLAQNSNFASRREAIFTILTTSYQYHNEIMHRLLIKFNFIEILIPFISSDLKMLIASVLFTRRIIEIIENLKIDDARDLFIRLLNANLFNEIDDSIQQFDALNLCIKAENNGEEEEDEDDKIDENCSILQMGKNVKFIVLKKQVLSEKLLNVNQ